MRSLDSIEIATDESGGSRHALDLAGFVPGETFIAVKEG